MGPIWAASPPGLSSERLGILSDQAPTIFFVRVFHVTTRTLALQNHELTLKTFRGSRNAPGIGGPRCLVEMR